MNCEFIHSCEPEVVYTYSIIIIYTVNHEIFVFKIFLDSMRNVKIKCTKIMCIINVVVRGRLFENYLTRKFIA